MIYLVVGISAVLLIGPIVWLRTDRVRVLKNEVKEAPKTSEPMGVRSDRDDVTEDGSL